MRQSRLVTSCLLMAASACTAPHAGKAVPELAPAGIPSVHALADERLRGLMVDLKALVVETKPSEPLERDRERKRLAADFADDVLRLSISVHEMAERGGLGLPPGARPVFQSMAERLRHEALALKVEAQAANPDAIRPALERIIGTCNECHARFRPARAASSPGTSR